MCDYGTINFNTYISYMYEHVLALTYIGYANIQFCCEKAHFEIFSQGKQKTIVHLKSLLPFLACFTQNVPYTRLKTEICLYLLWYPLSNLPIARRQNPDSNPRIGFSVT
jgi:hypothetical protein